MKKDFAFPNPLQRAELSHPRRKWKYILGVAVALTLLVIFLPNLLSSKIGRNLIKMRLESKYRGQVWVTDWRTRWFGPTDIDKFSLTDGQGRQIRFQHLSSPIGLWQLLFGKLDLKDATITGLYVEYVVDYGDGTTTLDRLPQGASPPPLVGYPQAARRAPVELPAISGHIKLNDGTLVLTRGQIELRDQLRTVYRSLRLSGISGTLDIASLDQPWQCDLTGIFGSDDSPGQFRLAGSFALGQNKKLDLTRGMANAQLTMLDVPNVPSFGTSPLGWLFFPDFAPEDYGVMFGPKLRQVDTIIKLTNGKLRLDPLKIEGQLADGRTSKLIARPVIDLTVTPSVLSLDGELVASLPMSRGLAKRFAFVNPFVHNASGGTGQVDVKLENLTLPLATGNLIRKISLQGWAAMHGVIVTSGQSAHDYELPRELTTQWQAIVGDASPMPKVSAPEIRFTVRDGIVSCEPYQITIDDQAVSLSGRARLAGPLEMQAELSLPAVTAQPIKVAIGGTVDNPSMQIPPNSPLTEVITRNMATLRARRMEHLMRMSEAQVREML
ncbi:MAG: hypothetical protein ACM359_22590, partial [Bacillota bacterium]